MKRQLVVRLRSAQGLLAFGCAVFGLAGAAACDGQKEPPASAPASIATPGFDSTSQAVATQEQERASDGKLSIWLRADSKRLPLEGGGGELAWHLRLYFKNISGKPLRILVPKEENRREVFLMDIFAPKLGGSPIKRSAQAPKYTEEDFVLLAPDEERVFAQPVPNTSMFPPGIVYRVAWTYAVEQNRFPLAEGAAEGEKAPFKGEPVPDLWMGKLTLRVLDHTAP